MFYVYGVIIVFKPIQIKWQLIIFLAAFAVFLAFQEYSTSLLVNSLIAITAALAIEAILQFVKTKKLKISDSAIITGLIIGFVLADSNHWWIFCVAAIIAIVAKYVIRFHGKHIFNPAALGIFLTAVFLGSQEQWHGTFLWYILLPAGLYFSYKIRKLEIIAAYGIFSLALFGVQAYINHVNLFTIFGFFSYFYIFIMVIEPKTTPIRRRGKIAFGAGIALAIFILSQFNINFDIELASLLLFNMFVPLLNKLPERKIV